MIMDRLLDFKQNSHLDPALTDPATRTLNADKLTGRWLNTNFDTKGVAEIAINQEDDQFYVSVKGVGTEGPIVWPTTKARVLANLEEEAGQRAVALAVTFDFDFMTAESYLRVNKGVLVIVLFNTFSDGSGRANYVTREFFYRPV
jgi:hypothetical protein